MYKGLLGTRQTLLEFASNENVSIENIDTSEIEQCSDCSTWTYKDDLTPDRWNNPQCPLCKEYYGL